MKWGARDKIKKASKGNRNLPLTIFSVCLEEAGFESQISLLNPPENFSGKLKVPGRESKEVVITEVWGGANQGFGSCFSSRKKKVQFEFKVLAMVFCYQNCSDLLWEKKVLVIEKNFEIRGWRPRIYKNFEITRTIYSNSERLEQFLVTECFFNLFLDVLHI